MPRTGVSRSVQRCRECRGQAFYIFMLGSKTSRMPRTGVSRASSRIPRTDVSCRFMLGSNDPGPERRGNAEDRRFLPENAECPRTVPKDRRFMPKCPRTGVSCPRTIVSRSAQTIQAPLICLSFLSRARRWLPERRGQALHARLERSRPRADLSFARPPLVGRPRLLGAAAQSGLYRDRTAGGERDECMRSRHGGELARRRSHRMQYPTIGR
jgi:hypothetical protein